MNRLERIDLEYTAENKDRLLNYLINKFDPTGHYPAINAKEISADTGICIEFIHLFLLEFNDLGIVEYRGFSQVSFFSLTITHQAVAFKTKGGFQFQEALFMNQLTLLQGQIKSLENELPPERLKNVLDIASNLINVYTAFFGVR